jgi:acyl-CoA thioesterase II
MAMFELDDLLACLDLRQDGDGSYTGANLDLDYYRIFGGQLLAQAIAVASTDTAKAVKSIHVAFPREGLTAEPVSFVVSRLHDGRSYSTRQITGVQSAGKAIVTAQVSCHVPEDGEFDHQMPSPRVGEPEDASAVELEMIPLETRVVDGVDLNDPAARSPAFAFWLRAARPLVEDPAVHQGLFAHCTDLSLIGTTLLPVEGYGQADSPDRLHTAVVTHSVWFHRAFRIDDWVLVSQESPSLAGARGFGWGHAFDRSGRLVASFAQESMIRRR